MVRCAGRYELPPSNDNDVASAHWLSLQNCLQKLKREHEYSVTYYVEQNTTATFDESIDVVASGSFYQTSLTVAAARNFAAEIHRTASVQSGVALKVFVSSVADVQLANAKVRALQFTSSDSDTNTQGNWE